MNPNVDDKATATAGRRVLGGQAHAGALELSVVIPVLNEVDSIAELHGALTATLEPMGLDYELIVIDDGSTDGTISVLAAVAEHDPRLKVVEFRPNFGQTAAISAGFDYSRGAEAEGASRWSRESPPGFRCARAPQCR